MTFYLFFHTIHPDCSFLCLHFSQLWWRPLPPDPPSLQRRAALPGISTEKGVTGYSKTRHKPPSHDWTRQCTRKKRVPRAGEREATPFPLLGVPQKHQAKCCYLHYNIFADHLSFATTFNITSLSFASMSLCLYGCYCCWQSWFHETSLGFNSLPGVKLFHLSGVICHLLNQSHYTSPIWKSCSCPP